MNYDGEATKYTAFALIAIESIWPNPMGNELAPDDYDLDLMGAESRSSAGKPQRQFSPQLKDHNEGGIQDERDYYNIRGYYKLIPLHIVSAQTSSTVDGSNFSVTFTLDDMLLVSDVEQGYLSAHGLPVSAAELVESDLVGRVPSDFLSEFTDSSDTRWEYKKDSELGLTRYKIDGANSSFNIEDLVEPNDTVTIWFYHDPSDFYAKDSEAAVNENATIDSEKLRLNQNLNHIVGSADRKNQFSVSEQTFEETLLGSLGLLNEFVAESIRSVAEIETGDDESQAPTVTRENYESILDSFIQEGTSGTLGTNEANRLEKFTQFTMEDDTAGSFVYDNFLKFLYDPRINYLEPRSRDTEFEAGTGEESSFEEETEIEGGTGNRSYTDSDYLDMFLRTSEDRRSQSGLLSSQEIRRIGRVKIMDILSEVGEHPDPELLYNQAAGTPDLDELTRLLNTDSSIGFVDSESFLIAANSLAKKLNEISKEYAREYTTTTTKVEQNFSNGRNVLSNSEHGETPYLALKGHVNQVTVNVGAAQGTNLVTITGSGYEKILSTSMVYYEDVFLPDNGIAMMQDFHAIYVNMIPPKAITHIINRWASKQVLLGIPNEFTIGAFNRFINMAAALNSSYEDEEDGEETSETTEDIQEDAPLGTDKIPIRGNYVLSKYVNKPKPEDVRLFSPLNYFDTTRITEMVNSINDSYQTPEVEAVVNTAIGLDTRKPIMENIRKVGGTANFYQLFVDESGRVRYRLSFESWERTPQPEFVPTIQDRDTLAEGSTFSRSDDEVVTMVDVRPLIGHHAPHVNDIAFVGRSVPAKGKLPLQSLGELNEYPESLSPELFRYGLRMNRVDDVYTAEKNSANIKAGLYRLFYEAPIKNAEMNVRLNPAYRPGETVLVSLQRTKHRSRTPINISATLDWLNKLKDGASTSWGKEVMKSYIGVDNRLRNRGSYALTGSYNVLPEDSLMQKYQEDPYMFVLDQFIKTFEFLQSTLGVINVITPEYFPNTYWFFPHVTGEFYHWNEGKLSDEQIIRLYENILVASVQGSKRAADFIQDLIVKNQGIINAIKFQNFRAASYYIQGVNHKFSYGASAVSTLSLTHGQDNLVLLDPKHHLPIGFLSLEKNMKIGYEDDVQKEFWLEGEVGDTSSDSDMSSLQRMYVNQLKYDRGFKSASFLYNASVLRNSSIYMHEIADRVGLEYGLTTSSSVTKSPPEDISTGSTNSVSTPATREEVPEGVTQDEDDLLIRNIRLQGYITAEHLGLESGEADRIIEDAIDRRYESELGLNSPDGVSKFVRRESGN